MSLRAALALVPAVLVAGVASAVGQQPAPSCLEERATIVGTAGNDTLTGTPGRDVILGLQGNDTIDAGVGTDLICAGDGDDVLLGSDGIDSLVGGLGNDRLDGGGGEINAAIYVEAPGAVVADLAAGSVTGASGTDTLANINAVLGSRRADTLRGGPGTDLLVGVEGRDVLVGRAGTTCSPAWVATIGSQAAEARTSPTTAAHASASASTSPPASHSGPAVTGFARSKARSAVCVRTR